MEVTKIFGQLVDARQKEILTRRSVIAKKFRPTSAPPRVYSKTRGRVASNFFSEELNLLNNFEFWVFFLEN